MKKKIVLLTGLVLAILSVPLVVLADSWNYYTTFTIEDTGGSNRNCLSPIIAMDIDSLADYGFIASDGMDTRVLIGSTEKHYMVVDDQLIVAVEDLNAYETQTMKFYQGYSPVQTSVDLLTGTGGKITVADDADLEPDDTFTHEFAGDVYLALGTGTGRYIIDKGAGDYQVFVLDNTNDIVAYVDEVLDTYYSGSADTSYNITSTSWQGQTFTTTNAGYLTAIKFYLSSLGNGETGYVRVYETSGGLPTGDALAIQSYTITASAPNTVYFGSNTTYLESSTQYAFVLSKPASSHNVYYDGSAPSYAGGTYVYTTDSGSSWTANSGNDMYSFYVYLTDASVVAEDVDDGEYDSIAIIADGTDLSIEIDGVEEDSTTLSGAAVDNNSTSWTIMDNSTTDFMLYTGYCKLTVSSTLIAWYQPNAIVVGTTLPDREGGDENGTFTFGSNSDMTVTILGTTSSTSTTSTTSTSGTANTVIGWDKPSEWEASESSLTSLPFYDDFNSAATDMGWETANLYGYIMIGVAIAAGVGVMALTGSLMLGACIEGAVLLGANNATIIDGWIVFAVFIFSLCLMYITRGRGAVTV